MDTETVTLAGFLLARIGEDEAAARAATPGPWSSECIGSEGWHVFGPRGLYERHPQRRPRTALVTWGTFESDKADSAHIARHDPARVLADCEAKRRIVERHYEVPASDIEWSSCPICRETWPCPDLRALAAAYADHPDYDESWRP